MNWLNKYKYKYVLFRALLLYHLVIFKKPDFLNLLEILAPSGAHRLNHYLSASEL